MTTLIKAEQLYRYYGRNCAVQNVSFSLSKGEVLGFLGPNGAGKTTTMQMLCGNLAPSSGQVTINHIDLLDRPKAAKSFLGYLPENPPLYKELTVQEFLEFCARLHRIRRNSVKSAIQRAKSRCGLEEVSNRLIANLSKGFQQRVGIAQAIMHNPEIIVLDEPTSGLDPIQIREIRALIRELGEDHGVILSTHILPEVQESCTRVQIINQGQLILNESIAGLKQHMSTATVLVGTRKPADLDIISNIPEISSIETLSDNRLRIHHNIDSSPAEKLAEIIIGAGWGLLELSPERRTMEEIFIDLTSKNNGEGG